MNLNTEDDDEEIVMELDDEEITDEERTEDSEDESVEEVEEYDDIESESEPEEEEEESSNGSIIEADIGEEDGDGDTVEEEEAVVIPGPSEIPDHIVEAMANNISEDIIEESEEVEEEEETPEPESEEEEDDDMAEKAKKLPVDPSEVPPPPPPEYDGEEPVARIALVLNEPPGGGMMNAIHDYIAENEITWEPVVDILTECCGKDVKYNTIADIPLRNVGCCAKGGVQNYAVRYVR